MIDKNLLMDITLGLWFTLATLLIGWFILHLTSKVSGNPEKLKRERQITRWFIKRYTLLIVIGSLGSYFLTMPKEEFANICQNILTNLNEFIGATIWVIAILTFFVLLAFHQPKGSK